MDLVPVTGLDCHFCSAKMYDRHQCLHWWPQMSTGHLHWMGSSPLLMQKGEADASPLLWCTKAIQIRTGITVGGVQYQLECIGCILITCFLCLDSIFKGLDKDLRGRDISAAKAVLSTFGQRYGHQVRVVGRNVLVTNGTVIRGNLHIVRNCAVDTSIRQGDDTIAKPDFKACALYLLAVFIITTEQVNVGDCRVMESVKEVKDFLRYVFPQQLVRVLIIPFIRPGFLRLDCVQVHRGQFSVGHVHSLAFIQPPDSAQCGLVLEVVLSQLVEKFRSVHVILKKNLHVDCHKRNLRQDFIEDVVIRDAMSLLTDENIEQIAEVAIRTNLHDVEGNTDIPAIKDRLHETILSLSNLVKAIESGLAPETLVKRMVELEKDKKTLEEELKREEKKVIYLDKEQVIFWLEQFKGGDIEDDDFRRLLVNLFVNSVTVWDEEDDHFKVTIAYNLSSLNEKTYHLKRGGRQSDFNLNAPGLLPGFPLQYTFQSFPFAVMICL